MNMKKIFAFGFVIVLAVAGLVSLVFAQAGTTDAGYPYIFTNGGRWVRALTKYDSLVSGTRTLQSSVTVIGNVGAGEDDLNTFVLPANSLSVNTQWIEVIGSFIFAGNANSKRVRAYWGANKIYDSLAHPQNGGTMQITILITRVSPTNQSAISTVIAGFGDGTMLFTDVAVLLFVGETVSNAITIKFTGEAVASNDIGNVDMKTIFHSAP